MGAGLAGDGVYCSLMKRTANGVGMTGAKGGGMHTSKQKKPLLIRLQLRLAQARFLTFSALLHAVLIVIGGGVVLFRPARDSTDFRATGGNLVTEDVTPVPPEDPGTPPSDPMPVENLAPAPNSSAMAVLVSTAPAPTAFNAAKLAPPATHSTGVEQAMREARRKAGKALAGGRPGGTAKFFGDTEPTASGFVGTFYDLKQTRSGKPTNVSPDEYHTIFRKFVREHWRESVLADYFHAPQKLCTPQIFIPNMSADEGPKAFDLADKVKPGRWLVHYKARVAPPADGTFHFVGGGDDVLVVRFNGKVVLDRCWSQQDEEWKTARNYDYGYTGIPNGLARGDALRLKAGQFYDMEVLIGEQPGGLVFFSLLLEEEGVEYRRDAKGNPILPVFRLAGGPLPEARDGQTFPPFEPVGPVWKAAPMKTGGASELEEFFTAK